MKSGRIVYGLRCRTRTVTVLTVRLAASTKGEATRIWANLRYNSLMLVGKKLGPFVIDKELGSGAMGSVFRAQNEQTGQVVAIKLISAALASNEQAIARFQREVSILKQLDHPNITKYFGSGRYHKVPFYIMEFIEGESLDHIVERRGRIGWEEVVAIGTQLCAALQYAHDKGIIHRDLKPANLMVLTDGTVKLTDFGIAKDTDVTALTAANSTLGTASYMAPEQCKGARDLTSKSDLYSMGVMFYELLTGRRPFEADNVMDMFMMHTTATFERPSRWVLEIPIWFDTLICELLEKDPLRRPENAAAVAKSLAKIKEKMLTQTSAGVDAATRRRVDRSAHDLKLSDVDKDLARTLLGKKRKVKAEAFYRKGWFTIVSVAVVAATLVLAIWFFFLKAPSAENLYALGAKLMQSNELKDRKEARSGPIEDFLRHYPDHPQAETVARWRDQVDAEVCEYQMKNRRGRFTPDGDAEKIAFAALDEEDAGRLDEAKKNWQYLLKYKSETDKEQRVWGFVGEKYLKELEAVDSLRRELQKKINEEKTFDKKHEGESRQEKTALAALRDEAQDGLPKARQRWDDLRESTKNQPEQRRWHLLAARKLRELPK